MNADARPRLVLTGITKRYPGVIANDGVDLTVQPGEIHAVLGENGAGKSTLMKIVCGVTKADAGTIRWEGRYEQIASPADARRKGIGMVFQHFSLFETLTVAENIALALDERMKPPLLAARIVEVSARYGLPVEPGRLVHGMSVGERQRVEIVRCLLQEPKLLIMDEPTSVLTPQAVVTLFETLRRLSAEGCSILYISHKLDEIRALCHVATVLRGGRVVGTAIPSEESNESLARMMIGRDLPQCRLAAKQTAEPRIEVRGLSLGSKDPFGTTLNEIALTVRSGEIVGIAGVSGNGQKELLSALSGETTVSDGAAVRICGLPVGGLGPAARRRAGLCFVPEERLGRGAVPAMSLSFNALLTGSERGMVRFGLFRRRAMAQFSRDVIGRFDVKCNGEQALAGSLSGGNLQKYIVGRETMLGPRAMVVAQPTWGVDVGSALLIRQALIVLRDEGVGLLVVSEELEELFMICDRIAVIAQGRLSRALPRAEASVAQIGQWMSGRFDAVAAADPAVIGVDGGVAHGAA